MQKPSAFQKWLSALKDTKAAIFVNPPHGVMHIWRAIRCTRAAHTPTRQGTCQTHFPPTIRAVIHMQMLKADNERRSPAYASALVSSHRPRMRAGCHFPRFRTSSVGGGDKSGRHPSFAAPCRLRRFDTGRTKTTKHGNSLRRLKVGSVTAHPSIT